jgi:ATP adenylyltransferase/5',5'''-P-1,P-4-tetraphosphate phosphorylase II
MVLATKAFEEQSTPLLLHDYAALWTCIQALNAFGFFNCGHESGARYVGRLALTNIISIND